MENRTNSNIFQWFWNKMKRRNDEDHSGGQRRNRDLDGFTTDARILSVRRAEMAKSAALTEHTEKLCTMAEAQGNAVLERLGAPIQHPTLVSPQPPAHPRRNTKPSLGSLRLSPLSDVPRIVTKDIDRHQRSFGSLDDEDNELIACLMPAHTRTKKAGKNISPTAFMTSEYNPCTDDAHTQDEWKAVRLTGSQTSATPPPPPQAVSLTRSRAPRLAVPTPKYSGTDKKVADGCRLQIATPEVEAVSAPRPPAVAKRTPVVTPLAPTPPTVPQSKRRVNRPGRILRPAKASNGAGKDSDSSPHTAKMLLQPLDNPLTSLSLSFKLISSDDWEKKIDGLKILQALAQHHSETLKTKLHEVCLVLSEEVKNLRSAVSCAAMETLAEFYVNLQKAMDPEVEGTGRALLGKLAQTTSIFVHQQANLALDAMVQNCSHSRTVTALLNAGLSHLCVAVRKSTAQHLHLVADSLGAEYILKAGRTFTERFLIAVSKLALDAAPEVRHHGQLILRELAVHKDFQSLWTKIIPDKERHPLKKILLSFQ